MKIKPETIERTRDYFRNPEKYRTRNQEILDRLAKGELQVEIAEDLGVSRQRIHAIKNRELARRQS